MSVREIESTDRMVGARGWGGGWEAVLNGDRASVIQSAKSSLDGWCVCLHSGVCT